MWLLFESFGSCADPSFASDSERLAKWVADQQYTNANLTSFGGMKMSPEPAAYGPGGKPYSCVCAYYANLGVLGLLRARAPGCTVVAERWIHWYLAHLDAQSAPDGVPLDEFYRSDGAGETNCIKPDDPVLCHHNDATDSAAATFFSMLWAAHQAGLSDTVLAGLDGKRQVEKLAGVVLKLQQSDGLCWAKATYRVKYLEDNSEVYAGLHDLSDLERYVFNDSRQFLIYRAASERVWQGVHDLYDQRAGLFLIAKFEDGKWPATNLDKWYPDTQAQLWPLLFGVVGPGDSTTLMVIYNVNYHWNGHAKPDWAAHPELVNDGSLDAGDAYAMLLAGQKERVQTFVQAAKLFKFRGADGFAGPFNVEDAGWWLQILARL